MIDDVMQPTPIGFGLFTLRQQLAIDGPGTIAFVAEVGYDGVETISLTGADDHLLHQFPDGAVPGIDPTELRHLLDSQGLVVSSIHAPLLRKDNANAILDEAETLGTDMLVVSTASVVKGFGPQTFADSNEVRRFGDLLSRAAELAAERGMRIGYHNHDFEVRPPDKDPSALEQLMEVVDSRVFIEFDVTWVERAGIDPIPIISRLSDRVQLLHGRVSLADAARVAPRARWRIADLGTVRDQPMEAARAAFHHLTGERWFSP